MDESKFLEENRTSARSPETGPVSSTNGMLIGVLLDGTKDGNKRMTLPQAPFHLQVWISVPRVVRSGLKERQ